MGYRILKVSRSTSMVECRRCGAYWITKTRKVKSPYTCPSCQRYRQAHGKWPKPTHPVKDGTRPVRGGVRGRKKK